MNSYNRFNPRFQNYTSNRYPNQRRSNRKFKYQESRKHEIIEKVQAQKGIRGQLVLCQMETDSSFGTLQSAADRINSHVNITSIGFTKEGCKFALKIDGEVIAEGSYESGNAAKKGLSELAINNLRRTCFTIVRKMHPRHSPKVDLPTESTKPSTSTAQPIGVSNFHGIGAKLMLQMGWSGGGLGVQEQGVTDIVQPYIQINRQGLGSDNITQKVRNVLQDYAASGDITSIAFSSDFTKEERCVIHEVARKLSLKSRSYGKDNDRVLVVQNKLRPWDLVSSLLDAGGENDQLKLLLPTDFET